MNDDENIVATTLKGHQASVLCLDLSSPDSTGSGDTTTSSSLSSTSSLLLSGSEDHTARLWDLREFQKQRRACLCIPTTGDVLSAVFAPNRNDSSTKSALLSSSPFARDHTVYLAVENNVLEYDLRYAEAPIVAVACNECSHRLARNLGSILQNQDEVNQISLAYGSIQKQPPSDNNKKHLKKGGIKRKSNKTSASDAALESEALYLAACDDAGKVRFMNVGELHNDDSSVQSPILHHDVNGVAVVPCCSFRPTDSPNKKRGRPSMQLVSGGTDCKVHLWDLARPK
jgi:WD40 repeat protein